LDALDDKVIEIPAPPLLTQIHNYSGPDDNNNDDSDSDNDICHWTGGVNNSTLSSDMGETGSSEGELLSGEELEGDVLVESLQKEVENKLQILAQVSPYTKITRIISTEEWKTTKKNRHLGYTGRSDRSCHCKDEMA